MLVLSPRASQRRSCWTILLRSHSKVAPEIDGTEACTGTLSAFLPFDDGDLSYQGSETEKSLDGTEVAVASKIFSLRGNLNLRALQRACLLDGEVPLHTCQCASSLLLPTIHPSASISSESRLTRLLSQPQVIVVFLCHNLQP